MSRVASAQWWAQVPEWAVRLADRRLTAVFEDLPEGVLLVVMLPVPVHPEGCRLGPIRHSCLLGAG
ncbi:MAG: hypothetical protein ACSLE6_19095 [Mycobacterium sp.]